MSWVHWVMATIWLATAFFIALAGDATKDNVPFWAAIICSMVWLAGVKTQ